MQSVPRKLILTLIACGTIIEGMISPLRQKRWEMGLTVREAAALVGIDIGQLSRIERTGRTTRETAERIAECFGVSEENVLYPERFLIPGARGPSKKSQKAAPPTTEAA